MCVRRSRPVEGEPRTPGRLAAKNPAGVAWRGAGKRRCDFAAGDSRGSASRIARETEAPSAHDAVAPPAPRDRSTAWSGIAERGSVGAGIGETSWTVIASGSICEVEENKCISCGACISVCKYGAIEFVETPHGKRAKVNPVLCKGDGLCNSRCPTGAISLKHFTDDEINCQIDQAASVPTEVGALA